MTRRSLILGFILSLIPSRFRCTWCGSLLKCHGTHKDFNEGRNTWAFLVGNDAFNEWCPNEKCGWWDIMPTRQEYEAEVAERGSFHSSGDWRAPSGVL